MIRLLRLTALVLATGLTAVSARQAEAGPVFGNQAFADIGVPALIGSNDISTATGFTFGQLQTTASRDGGFLALAGGQVMTTTTFTPASPGTFSLGNGVFGTFTATTSLQLSNTGTARSFLLNGFYTPGSGFGGGSAQAATLTLSFTQNGGPGTSISASATLSTAVPEPVSVAMLGVGVGVVGLASYSAVRRRKSV